MSSLEPATVLCTYRVKPDKEDEFLELLRQHWPKLRELGMVTSAPSTVYRGTDGEQRPYFVEIFSWSSPEVVERAHQHPEIMAIWEPMDLMCEARDGRPNMEFPHVERVSL